MAETKQSIRAVIFDFGGVLMRTESGQAREVMARQYGLTLPELYVMVFDSEESRLAQLGLASPDARWQRIGQQLGFTTHEQEMAFRRAMFADDVLDAELVRFIRGLRGRLKTALLSNASLRLEAMLRDELHIEDCFDVIVVSAQVGLMKPDPAIFHLTLEQLGVTPQEAVFIDDNPANVDAAAAMGLHAIRFTSREALLAELQALGVAPPIKEPEPCQD